MVRRFEDRDLAAGAGQVAGRGKAGADDADIGAEWAHAATRANAEAGSGPFSTAAAACSSWSRVE